MMYHANIDNFDYFVEAENLKDAKQKLEDKKVLKFLEPIKEEKMLRIIMNKMNKNGKN